MPFGVYNPAQNGIPRNSSSFQEQRTKHFEGQVAKVAINGAAVTFSTDSWGWDQLQEKVINQALLKDLLYEVPNVDVPKALYLKDDAHSIEVERAKGINLNVSPAFAQGSSQDYFQLPFETKFQRMYT